MQSAQFKAALATLPLTKSAYFESVGSTNDVVADWAANGLQPPALAAADEQTQGRGRHGRNWFTPPGSALAFSLLLADPQNLDSRQLALVSGLGGLAVCLALEELYGLAPQIKWPNDVLLGGKKTCGVLAEAHWQGKRLAALILGIGINVAPPSVPPEGKISFPATCVDAAFGQPIERPDLLVAIAKQVLAWLPKLNTSDFLQSWEARLAYKNQIVRMEGPEDTVTEGVLLGLAANGNLRLQLEDSQEQVFQAGEIHLRPIIDSAAK